MIGRAYLELGRPSNLPTVWTNVLAGTVLAGGAVSPRIVAPLVATSLLYSGGMFLNDVFDRKIDAAERPERPIPSGRVTAGHAAVVGAAMLAAGVIVALAGSGPRAGLSALVLAAAIVAYDLKHKRNPVAPAIMGLCRALVYVTAAIAATGGVTAGVLGGATALFAWVVGLTVFARRISAAAPVARLIAGISILDAAWIALSGRPLLALVAASGFFATLALQRWVRGT